MLRISKLTDYGTVIMNCLAKAPKAVISANEVARQVQLSVPTVSKVLKRLVCANLIISERGHEGGYRLARKPEQITLAAIISALEGEPALTECNATIKTCSQDAICGVRDNWRVINRVIMQTLHSVTLADMAKPLQMRPFLMQEITSSP